MEEYNFGGLTDRDKRAVENTNDIGEDVLPFKDISKYKEINFIKIFGENNIDRELKLTLIKYLEDQIILLEQELIILKNKHKKLSAKMKMKEIIKSGLIISDKEQAIELRKAAIKYISDYN